MQCQSCHGTGEHVFYVTTPQPPDTPSHVRMPCSECGGSGITHCCEGLVCQEEPSCDTPS